VKDFRRRNHSATFTFERCFHSLPSPPHTSCESHTSDDSFWPSSLVLYSLSHVMYTCCPATKSYLLAGMKFYWTSSVIHQVVSLYSEFSKFRYLQPRIFEFQFMFWIKNV